MNLKIKTIVQIILFASVFTINFSCMKPPAFEDQDGTAVDIKVVQKQMLDAWGTADPSEIKQDEFHYQEKTIQISTLRPQIVLQKGITVSQVEDVGTDRTYHLLIQSSEILDNSQSKLSTRERIISVVKPNASTSTPATTTQAQGEKLSQNKKQAVSMHMSALQTIQKMTVNSTKSELHSMADETEISQMGIELFINILNVCNYENFQCFNLLIEKAKEPAPDLVKQQPNCLGLANCEINVKKVQFDVVYTNYDKNTQTTTRSKVIYKMKFSPDVPFLSHLLEFCYMGMAASNSQRFPVEICYSTQNFRPGSTTPPPAN